MFYSFVVVREAVAGGSYIRKDQLRIGLSCESGLWDLDLFRSAFGVVHLQLTHDLPHQVLGIHLGIIDEFVVPAPIHTCGLRIPSGFLPNVLAKLPKGAARPTTQAGATTASFGCAACCDGELGSIVV